MDANCYILGISDQFSKALNFGESIQARDFVSSLFGKIKVEQILVRFLESSFKRWLQQTITFFQRKLHPLG